MTTESRALLQDYIIDVEAAKPKVSGYLDLLCLERETPLRTVLQEEERAAIEAHGLTLNSFDQSQLSSL